jgi:hypothetical protein
MLGTATYAWFTMSREVEVQNIQMTATTPEDIQLSLGELDGGILASNTGVLKNGAATLSTEADYWSNTADISKYYTLGKIIPASSYNGTNIWFTPDAAGVGKTLKENPKYYQADGKTDAEITGTSGDTDSAMTTLHVNTTNGGDGWGTGGQTDTYRKSTAWNNTNDDGYYVDIPVWLRTSSTANTSLSVDAYVVKGSSSSSGSGTSSADTDELYKAVRVVVLDDSNANLTNLIQVRDSNDYTGNSIVDYMTTTVTENAVSSVSGTTATYSAASTYDGSQVISLTSGTGTEYGTPKKVYIRVWLEGEDPNCWNENAGQDFSINLKFVNGATTPATAP